VGFPSFIIFSTFFQTSFNSLSNACSIINTVKRKKMYGGVMMLRLKNTVLVILIMLGVILLLTAPGKAAADTGARDTEEQQMSGVLFAFQETVENGKAGKQKVFLPLRKTDVMLEVFAGVVKANVSQVFKNDTGSALEAIYVFPLPAKAAVTDMVLKVDDRIIRSVIQERQEAKKTYQAAKAAGKKTALMEQERPNIFTTSVANFLPGETVEISFSYMEPLEYQEGMYTVNFPMVVGQRYVSGAGYRTPPGEAAPDAGRLNPPLLHPNLDSQHRLSLIADVIGIPVKTIVSHTHAIDVQASAPGGECEKYRVSLTRQVTVPDCDFNMKIYLEEENTPRVSYVHSRKDEQAYGMVTVFPPVLEGEPSAFAMPRDVVFLIDTSGSMSGQSIYQAKTGLTLCMKMLRPEDNFTIVRFSSDFSFFSPTLKPASQSNIFDAKQYIAGLVASGGTEMQQALRYVLGMPKRENALKMIVFLTDGAVGNEDSLFRLLSDQLAGGRLFTFGIGSAPNEYLMRKIAEIGRGQSHFIHSNEDVGEVMANFFKTLDSPVLTDIAFTWEAADGSRIDNVEFYPNPCPDVYFQRPIQVFIKYPESGKPVGDIVVSGMLGNKPVEYLYHVKDGAMRRVDSVDRRFGKAKIKELMYRHIRSNSQQERDLLRREVIDVSLGHQVLSKFTARVAVEERVTRDPGGELNTVKVKVPLPKGWDPSKFNATASDLYLWLLVGFLLIVAGLIDMGIRRVFKL
jgi:Ca-activated chloride channel family protein